MVAAEEDAARPRSPRTLPRVLETFTPYRGRVALVTLLILVTAGVGIVNPLLIKVVIDRIVVHDLHGAITYSVVMIVFPVVLGVLGAYQTYLNNSLGQRVMQDLRNRLYEHLQRMPLRWFTDTRTGEIQSRLANDVGGVENVLTNTASQLVSNVTIVLSTVVAMVALDWRLTVVTLAIIPVFILVTRRVGALRREVSRQTQRTLADLTALTQETLSVSGVLLMKVFGREAEELERFRTENRRLSELYLRGQMVGRYFFSFIQVFFSIMPAVVYIIAAWLIIAQHDHAVSVGTIVAFTTLQSRLFFPVGQLLNLQTEIQSALALFDRIFEYLDLVPEIIDRPDAVELDTATSRGRVEFSGVSFAYAPGAPLTLRDVSFTAEPGQLVALVGPSGAGKTTILYQIPRLYEVQAGTVSIDGRDVRDVNLRSLARLIGIVTQETYLFHASVRQNLLYGRPGAGDAELDAAAEAAGILDRIRELPEGYDTIVGERGYKMSGGEKQRLAIARVILKDPRVLLLDEATSQLDTGSERLIQAALERLMEGRTTIAIAHRLSTILRADQILVINRGRIVERGSHAELLAEGGLYARLYRQQFAAEAEGRGPGVQPAADIA